MNIISVKNYLDLSRRAAGFIASQVTLKPDCVLGLATGSTPIGIYRDLIERYRRDELDFSRVRVVNLDEYRGLAPTHPRSYAFYMREHLFEHVNIDEDDCFLPDGLAEDAEVECARYDELIEELGGIDLQLLGLGHNGHIGFNEPGDAFIPDTHLVTLSESTIEANSRFFDEGEAQPASAYTLGIRGILSARRILLVVSGASKAEALQSTLCGPVTPRCPASVLQLHPDVTVIADEDALSKMVL